MPQKLLFYIFLFLTLSCKTDPTGPEMGCQLNDLYVQDYHFLKAAKVFDVRTDPPLEIRNDTIEYALSTQWFLHHDDIPARFPYPEYFIDSIVFLNATEVEIHFFEKDSARIYSYSRDDCGLDLTSPHGELHLELTHGGEEMTEQRFALYDHRKRGVIIDSMHVRLDTFSFIEFRLGPFATYEEVIRQFALEYPGEYDTIGIELVQNKTRE